MVWQDTGPAACVLQNSWLLPPGPRSLPPHRRLAHTPPRCRAPTCSAYNLPVRIADPGPADQTLWGQLCYRGDREPGTVQLLVHGATYNHLYWNFPYGNGYYSYVDAATAAGYATFDIDRIGAGNSSHPPSASLDLTAGAVALHDAVTALRSGAVDGHAFRHVIAVGHSIGSVEIWLEAARYHDVDAVIVTGALHALSPDIGALQSDLYPAADDPAFAGSGLDPGYLTTLPGTRESLFYDPATANPAVVAVDEASKGCDDPGGTGRRGIDPQRASCPAALLPDQRAGPVGRGRGRQPLLYRRDRLQLRQPAVGTQL